MELKRVKTPKGNVRLFFIKRGEMVLASEDVKDISIIGIDGKFIGKYIKEKGREVSQEMIKREINRRSKIQNIQLASC